MINNISNNRSQNKWLYLNKFCKIENIIKYNSESVDIQELWQLCS